MKNIIKLDTKSFHCNEGLIEYDKKNYIESTGVDYNDYTHRMIDNKVFGLFLNKINKRLYNHYKKNNIKTNSEKLAEDFPEWFI
jgi:hypothetical protein